MKFKRITALAVAGLLALGGLSACKGGGGKDGGSKELSFGIWDENQRPVMEEMAKKYEESHKDVKITIQLTP